MLLSDVVLPGGMDGVALADSCVEQQPDMPVALVSGYPTDALTRGARDPSRYALLPKPYSTAQLAEFIEGVLASYS